MNALQSDLLNHIKLAAFTNPFDPERTIHYQHVAGLSPSPSATLVAPEAMTERIESAHLDLSNWPREKDPALQTLKRGAALFYLFQRHSDGLCELIVEQEKNPDQVIAHDVTDKLYRDVIAHGFTQEYAAGFVGMAFQFRRAYHFTTEKLKGSSAAMQRLRMHLWRSIFTDDIQVYESHMWNRMQEFSTLLLGPTGTGKGVAASIIGLSSYVPYNPAKAEFVRNFAAGFVELNLSQFPASLIESELFGHRKGAFTGATSDYQGHLQRCASHGVLFLDEIGELQPDLQIKLLRVLQDRTYTPVGGQDPRKFLGRIVSATNRSLDELREQGSFRDDFYYRIATDVIQLPTLQDRLADTPAELHELAAYFLEHILGRKDPTLEAKVLETLTQKTPKNYPWPGNVRELEQAVRSILLTGHFHPTTRPLDSSDWLTQAQSGTLSASDLMSRYCAQLYTQLGSYEAVARRIDLDRRTVKKYVDAHRG